MKSELADAFAVATDPAAAASAAIAANSGQSPRDASPTGDASGEGAQDDERVLVPEPEVVRRQVVRGRGRRRRSRCTPNTPWDSISTAPAGAVSRALIAALAADAGTPLPADADAEWVKKDWLDAMERLGVSHGNTHAALTAAGRSWKVCWVEDALEKAGAPRVLVWAPERNAYYTLGSLAAAGGVRPRRSRRSSEPSSRWRGARRSPPGSARSPCSSAIFSPSWEGNPPTRTRR